MSAAENVLWGITRVLADLLIAVGGIGAVWTLWLALNEDAFENHVRWLRQRREERETRAMVKAWCLKRYGR